MPSLQLWYDFASTYSYLSVMRIERLAAQAGVEIVWRPFLLGPIFKAQGWASSPFNIYPAKGRYMVRDLQRLAADRGLPFVMPQTFPAASLLPARLAIVGEAEGWTARFTTAAFAAQFGRGADIGSSDVLTDLLTGFGIDAARAMAAAGEVGIKDKLKARTGQAQSIGLFGAPSFVTDRSEIFWGDDRLEQAIAWAVRDG